MNFSQESITEAWLLLGLVCLPLSLVNHWVVRVFISIIFFVFAFVSSFRPFPLFSDTHNYLLHAQAYCAAPATMATWFGGNFEPGYNALIHFITNLTCDSRSILLSVSMFICSVWVYTFLRFKIHPCVMMLIFSGVTLVGSIAALRHHLAMAVIFFLVFHRKNSAGVRDWLYYLAAPLIHYSAIPAVILLATGDLYRSKGSKILPLFIVSLLFLALIFRFEFIESLLIHAADRISGDSGSTGLRNLMAFVIVFLAVFGFDTLRINISKLNFEILAALAMCVVLLFFPGLNRMSGFFWLISLGLIASPMTRRAQIGPAIIVVSMLNLGSMFFFFKRFS